jgi:hypothetical protein
VAGVADGDVQDMEVIVTQVYDCRTTGERLAALEARLAQTDDALWLALDGPEDRLKEVSDGSSNNS